MAYLVVSPTQAVAARPRLADRYFQLLCSVLIGYACLGKTFAYIGLPPLFIGELSLAFGLVVLANSGCSLATLASLPTLLLVVLMCWTLTNTLPYLSVYGFDALRDSVIVGYGLFAYVVIGLLLERPHRLQLIVAGYGRFAWFYGLTSMILYFGGNALPLWQRIGITGNFLRPGEVAVHLSGAAVFALLGMRRFPVIWVVILLVGIVSLAGSRGALLACVIPIGMAAILGGQLPRLIIILSVSLILLFSAYIAGDDIVTSSGRSIGPRQLIENAESIFGTSDAENLDGTKTWRLRWWRTIAGYTFGGRYFWTGKGSGINLAEADGFVVGTELGGPPLRSPHNANLTILARYGVPGLALWAVTLTAWFSLLCRSMIFARRRGHRGFANLFLWIVCYVASALIDASVDVALEGPMLGIWFWCLFGLGIGSAMIYRAAINSNPLNSLSPQPDQHDSKPYFSA